MKTLHEVETQMIRTLDKYCDDNKIEWQPLGSKLRGIMLVATLAAYNSGIDLQKEQFKQQNCKHDYEYNRESGKCRLCGKDAMQCSSD